MDAARSGWIAEERNRVAGQELTETGAKLRECLTSAAKQRELNAWKKFKVSQPVKVRAPSKLAADTRRVRAWKMVHRSKDVKACFSANGYQDPELMDGLVENSGCVGIRSSRLQVIPRARRGNGTIGVWTLRMPFCSPTVWVARYFFALLWDGAPMPLTAFGNVTPRRMA